MVCVLYDNNNVLSLKTDNLYGRLLMKTVHECWGRI